jgi:hypothetical protein
VNPLVLPKVERISVSEDSFSLMVTGPAGLDYTVLASPDLLSWEPVLVTNSPPLPFSCSFTNVNGLLNRFFRIQIGP